MQALGVNCCWGCGFAAICHTEVKSEDISHPAGAPLQLPAKSLIFELA